MTDNQKKDWAVAEIIDWTTKFFKANSILESRLDAELILSGVLAMKRLDLYLNFDRLLTLKELADFKVNIKKRIEGLPIAYILGKKEFMSLTFKVTPDVLIPRPETEFLVEEVLRVSRNMEVFQKFDINSKILIVDTFTGSGNIPISLAKHLNKILYFIYGIDINLKAVKVAHENSLLNQTLRDVRFLHGDILLPLKIFSLKGMVDIITANPPYLKTSVLSTLRKEVKCEPKIALDGGEDGLIFYSRLIDQALDYLKVGGYLVLEIDPELNFLITEKLELNGFGEFNLIKDLQGLDRVLSVRRLS
ncbi:MAG: peptide chain release factor N(5)-glutamine methyltransferase [bacterium]|nr:peptide chain release factor N(5)-glutamine methyltransferase [bacterium]